MVILETKDLIKYYGEGENLVRAVDGINFSVDKGEFVSIVGQSGSGKSTLLQMLGGLERPSSGDVIIEGEHLFGLEGDDLTIFRRRKIGFVFQSYNLIPILNVYENIVLPLELDGKQIDEDFAKETINILGLNEKLTSLPNNLSGGQQQRVAIARALVTKPSIILADEPTGNLDTKISDEVVKLLKSTGKTFGQTIIMITHNESIAQMADRIVNIEDGKIKKEVRINKVK